MRKITDSRWANWPIEASISEEIYDDNPGNFAFSRTELDRMAINNCLSTAQVLDYDSHIKRFAGLYGKLHGMSGYGILSAHGCTVQGTWVYCDENKYFSVQGWINENDGKHAALILSVCNEDAKEIHSKKSLIVSPNNIISVAAAQLGGMFQNEIYCPGRGYISSYCIDSEMERLALKIKKEEMKTLEILLRNARDEILKKRREESD